MKKYYLITILISFLPVAISSCLQTPMDLSNEETLLYSRDSLYVPGYCGHFQTEIKDSTIKNLRLSFTIVTDCIDSSGNPNYYITLFADKRYYIERHGVENNFSYNQSFDITTEYRRLQFYFSICCLPPFYIKATSIKLFKVNSN